MQVLIRKSINIDKEPDLDKLTAWQQILVSFLHTVQKLPTVKRRRERELEQAHRKRIETEEILKEEILTPAYREIVKNRRLSKKGLVCKKIVLAVDRSVEKELREIIKHNDFVSFNLRIIEANKDMLRSYKVPLLVEVTEKVLGWEVTGNEKGSVDSDGVDNSSNYLDDSHLRV